MSADSMLNFFAQPRGTAGQQQSTDSMSSTQMRFSQMSQGMGMSSGAGTGTSQQQTDMPSMPGMDSMRQQGISPGTMPATMQGTIPRTTQQQTDISSMPGMGSMRQQVTPPVAQIDIEPERPVERTPVHSVPEPEHSELLQLSLQEALARNIGEFVVVELLIGTNIIEKKQGVLYNVGISYIVLFEEQTKTFVICDFYSIKFATFYLPGQRPPQPSTGGQNMRGR